MNTPENIGEHTSGCTALTMWTSGTPARRSRALIEPSFRLVRGPAMLLGALMLAGCAGRGANVGAVPPDPVDIPPAGAETQAAPDAGAAANSAGSSVAPDLDDDGIADSLDECLDTPAGEPVLDNGCAAFAGPIENLDFAPGSDELNALGQASLDELVERMNRYPDVIIALGGHTDNRGKASNNLELSKRRVMSVARYLVLQGIEPDRLRPFGYGESEPVVSNATEAGRQQNRRIEVSVFTE